MSRLAAALAALLLLFALPAEAHRLKLFAQATGENIAGYGFFIGGGRPQGADLLVTMPDGTEVSRLKTGADGGFSFAPPAPGRYHLSLAAGDGHFAELDISTDGTLAAPAAAPPQASVTADLDARIEAAVARQIRPLLEAYEAADGRVRFNDLIGGLGWIVGLFGLWAWLRSRRDRHGD
ncbi:hypothetical protein [Pleomorphomonas koreensis]|uniref:hypothetical protein n=1 Tax=Pleomorphomonas koreensis TaxID=257440 RepID=UPI000400EFD3|nr:hypothetical protein [Pleomorphomonas koreensis]